MKNLLATARLWAFFLPLATGLLLWQCGPRQFSQGEYDDVTQVRHLDDSFNESDAQILIEEMVDSMAQHPIFSTARVPPVVQVERVRNRTSEHIGTSTMTGSMRTALIKTGKVRFADRDNRELMTDEIDYQQQSGRVRRDTQTRRDGAIGANYLLTGDLTSNVQQVGSRKLVYYNLILNLTNLETGLIEWSEEKPIRKRFRKRAVGL